MSEKGRGGPPAILLLLLGVAVQFSAAAVAAGELLHQHDRMRRRAERFLSAFSAGAAPSPSVLLSHLRSLSFSFSAINSSAFLGGRWNIFVSSNSRVFRVTDYGADPTGRTDSTAAIQQALSDAFRPLSGRSLLAGIADLGGAEINLEGGSYLITRPISLPFSPAGNLKIHSGSLRASDDFPENRYVIELWASSSNQNRVSPDISSAATSAYDYEYITLSGIMVDANFRGGGIAVVNSLRTIISGCYIAQFESDGIWVQGGHETFISDSFLGQHITAGADPGERNFSSTAIRLMGNDNAVTDVVIFSAATGILVAGQANVLTGVHCYNKATGFGGTGIYLKSPGLTQNRIVNCYMDYTGIVSEDPTLLLVSGSFFLGDAGVVLKSVNGVMRGVDIVDNLFSGSGAGADIVRLDESGGAFTAVDQVRVERNSVEGMRVRSTSARAAGEANGSIWTVDFSPVLLFANRIDHVQYAVRAGSGFPNHALRNVSGNRVVIESDVPVAATVYVAVDQCGDSSSIFI
ncbi:Polygalacturonase QRT3 [Apostasia shenzhenica]|uniref:Polygalacturonase QRT3 n=1 Tax=Apostasia shenzhenica TaxID=1088818 RepID=A0A2I0B1D7_9ASPA|nr:Polygalacturonase QRT3 [Apostasia shenzhenica]